MGWQDSVTFKTICKLVLFSFYFQTINPASFGYGPDGFRWPISFNQAAADVASPMPPQNLLSSNLSSNLNTVTQASQPTATITAPDEDAALTVARTLSAYTVGGVQDHQLTITYTVFNRKAQEVDGILLTTTLAPGVGYTSASKEPDRNGQELAWGLGKIAAYSSARVQLTLTLDSSTPLQLDGGAHAWGTLNARSVDAVATPATLRADTIAGDVLKCTADANCEDPFIIAKAAELGNDPQQIFAFLRDDIGYESYLGSLRGARGALWSKAGNALDQASLMIALLRASGIPARYVGGILPDDKVKPLILSMFPSSYQTVGYLDPNADQYDPTTDLQLLEETRQHYWVEYDDGSGWQAADPTIPDAAVGQTFTANNAVFEEVNDSLRHKVTVRLKRELWNIFETGQTPEAITTLEHTFNTVDTVGRPLSLGHFVNSDAQPGMIFATTTYTYSPYISVGDDALDPSENSIIRGTDYQEILTNFPGGTQLLTGVFLEFDVQSPDGKVEHLDRTLFDRYGYAARHTKTEQHVQMNVKPEDGPAMTELNVHSINILPALYNSNTNESIRAQAYAQSQTMLAQCDIANNNCPNTAGFNRQWRSENIALARLIGGKILQRSDELTRQISSVNNIKSYFDSPRIYISSINISKDAKLSNDLRKDNIRSIPARGASRKSAFDFNVARGLAQSAAESVPLSNEPNPPLSSGFSAGQIIELAHEQNINLIILTPDMVGDVERLNLSSEAKVRVTQSLHNNFFVTLPERMVDIGESETIAWFQTDINSGFTEGVLESGTHGFIEDFLTQYIMQGALVGLAALSGSEAASLLTFSAFIAKSTPDKSDDFDVKKEKDRILFWSQIVIGASCGLLLKAPTSVTATCVLAFAAFEAAFYGVLQAKGIDPPISGHISNLKGIRGTNLNLASSELTLTQNTAIAAAKSHDDILNNRIDVSGQLIADWGSHTKSTFKTIRLETNAAVVKDSKNLTVGIGQLVISLSVPISFALSGDLAYHLVGTGQVFFYSPATSNLGVSGDWENYTADITGKATIKVTTDALKLNGQSFPAGDYIIETSAAKLTGSGSTSAASFAGIADLSVTDGTVNLGPSSGGLNLGNSPLALSQGATLSGFTGNLQIQSPDDTQTIKIDGQASDVLRVESNPSTIHADQNTPASFKPVIHTSFADTYTLTAEAPSGWTVAFDDQGQVVVTPKPGLQDGSYPVHITARSKAKPELVAQADIPVLVGATQPGITADIVPDSLFTVPFKGAQVTSAYRAQIHNVGPKADTFQLNLTTIPQGFEILNSGLQVTIPAGETGEIGLYLRPVSALPAAGSQVSFGLDAISISDPSVKASAEEDFVMPSIHEASLALDSSEVSVAPDSSVSATLTLSALGNLPENVSLQSQLPAGLNLSGLPSSMTLGLGETRQFALTLNADSGLPIGQSVDVVLIGDVAGAAQPSQRTTTLHVNLRSAQGVTIDNAVQQSLDGSNTQLPAVLSDLRTTLEQWAAAPDTTSYCERAKLQVDNLVKLVAGDALLSGYASDSNSLRSLVQSCNLASFQNLVPPLFQGLAESSALGVVALFAPNTSFALPGETVITHLTLKNRGKKAVTLSLGMEGLPANVVSNFSTSNLQLAAGASETVDLSLTPAAAGRFSFSAVAQVVGFDKKVKASGQLISGQAAVNVLSVSGSPAYILKDGQTQIKALIANTSGIPTKAKAVVNIKNANGNSVYQSPSPILLDIPDDNANIPLELDVVTAAGWAEESYSIELSLVDSAGKLLPGGQGLGTLNVGTPIKATASVNPILVPPGNSQVTTHINVEPRYTGLGGRVGLEPTDMNKDRINWAAASRGGSITLTNPGPLRGTINALIDELPNSDPSSHWVGVGWNLSTPGNFLLDLGQIRTIDTLHFRVWDGDDRYARYKVEGSLDNQTFFSLADKSTGEQQGLQLITFQPAEMRYVRITGLFDSRETSFYLYDEIMAIGDDVGEPMPIQSVTLNGVDNSGSNFNVGKRLRLNAGIYEVTRQSGAVSWWANDSDNSGKSWFYGLRATMPLNNYQADQILYYPSAIDVENAVGVQRFKIHVTAQTDVYFWIYDTNASDNRGDETFEIRQVSGPNDSLQVRIRDAMMRSVLWEQTDVAAWQNWTNSADYNCFGCHVQAQASAGLSISKQKLPELPLDHDLHAKFVSAYRAWQNAEGGWISPFDSVDSFSISQSTLWAWAVSKFEKASFDLISARFIQALDWLLTKRNADGTWTDNANSGSVFAFPGGQLLYIDGEHSGTLTAENIQSMALALNTMSNKSLVELPSDEISVSGGLIESQNNPGQSFDISFDPLVNVTAVRITVNDTYASNGNFVISELQAFQGLNSKAFVNSAANFEEFGYPISDSYDGIKDTQNNGWGYSPKNTRTTPAQGVWSFSGPVAIDRLNITEIYPEHQLKKFKIEVTTDTNPSLNSQYSEVTGVRVGYSTIERPIIYRNAIIKAANTFSDANWPFSRNTRTTAQTIIGLNAALPYLSGEDLNAAVQRISNAEQHLRSTQHEDGGWNDSGSDASQALPSAEALEALLLGTKNSSDPAVVAGAEYLISSQKSEGSWNAPPGLQKRLASTTWVQIALPTIFENLASITLSVDHRAPLGSKAEPVANSFNPVLDTQTPSGGQLNAHWSTLLNSDAGQGFSLVSQLQDMMPGEVRQVSLGTTINYSSVAGNGKVELEPLYLSAQHILQITPSQTSVVAGSESTFTVTLENLLSQEDTFNFNLSGLPEGSVVIPSPVTLPAGGKTTIQLPLKLPVNSLAGDLNLSVAVNSSLGVKDSANAVLSVTENTSSTPVVDLGSEALDLSLINSFSAPGQGTSASFRLRLTNMGSDTSTYNLAASGLPSGFSAVFSNDSVTLGTGISNFREVSVSITTPLDIAKGSYPVVFTAVSANNPAISKQVLGSVTVSEYGVGLVFEPAQSGPNTVFGLWVKNTGSVADIFDLTLGGAGSLAASLNQTSVALDAGASWEAFVTVQDYNWSLPGSLMLIGQATSRSDQTVKAQASATINVAAQKAMSATLNPATKTLADPGSASFAIEVKNIGNIEDGYSAVITRKTGSLTASLQGLDGNPTQQIPLFRLPGLATGSINLTASTSKREAGSITILIASNSDSSISSEVTAQLTVTGSDNHPPVANAGENKNVSTGSVVTLDGSNSSDPDGNLLSDYRWRFAAVPAGSAVNDALLENNGTPNPRFTSDIPGIYQLELIVSDGLADSAADSVDVIAAKANVAPNADAGQDKSVAVGETVILDGSGSVDPDGGPASLQFAWRLNDPSQSGHVTLTNADTSKLSFSTDAAGDYAVVLSAFDGKDYGEDTVTVSVTPANVVPVADAGQDLAVQLGNSVALSAAASHDPDNSPFPLTFTWSFVSLPIGSNLVDALIERDPVDPVKAKFVPDVLGDYVLQLSVFDGSDNAIDNLLVKVLPALRYQEISDLVQVASSAQKSALDRITRKMTSSVTLTLSNKSEMDIKTPIRMVFELTSSNVSIPGSKVDEKGRSYLELSNQLLKPGESTSINVQFVYPSGTSFTYKTQVFGAVVR